MQHDISYTAQEVRTPQGRNDAQLNNQLFYRRINRYRYRCSYRYKDKDKDKDKDKNKDIR
jgi:hypothetical protein